MLPPVAKINTSILHPSWKLCGSNIISHPPVSDFWAKKINFQEGIQDKSIYFWHRWRWSKSGLGELAQGPVEHLLNIQLNFFYYPTPVIVQWNPPQVLRSTDLVPFSLTHILLCNMEKKVRLFKCLHDVSGEMAVGKWKGSGTVESDLSCSFSGCRNHITFAQKWKRADLKNSVYSSFMQNMDTQVLLWGLPAGRGRWGRHIQFPVRRADYSNGIAGCFSLWEMLKSGGHA